MSGLTRVWRYEDPKTGLGPYNNVPPYAEFLPEGALPLDKMYEEHFSKTRETHLSWKDDGMNDIVFVNYPNQNPYVAACPTREALDTWFKGWTAKLKSLGYQVVAYDVPQRDVVMSASGTQCAFLPYDAKRVEK